MYSTKLSNSCQYNNYARIPNYVIESDLLSFSEKKILCFLYGIQVYWHVPLCNIIRGWNKLKDSNPPSDAPSQLRKVLIILEEKGFIKRIFEQKKLTAVELVVSHPSIACSKYFYLKKEILANQSLKLNHILVIAAYTRFYEQKTNYTLFLSKVLGISPTTFRLILNQLRPTDILVGSKTRLPVGIISTTYKLNSKYFIRSYTSKTLIQSIHKQEDDFWCLKNYFLTKIKNNTSMQGILKMEKKKSSKKLEDYASMSRSEFEITLNAVHLMLHTSGCVHEKDYVRKEIIKILLSNNLRGHTGFENDLNFYKFLTSCIRNLHKKFLFNPLSADFIGLLREHLTCVPSYLEIYNDIANRLATGFTFKSESHALKFFVGRYMKKQFTERQRLEGIKEKINSTPIDEPPIYGESESIGDILKRLQLC